ncbi:MAG: DNA repair protein RecO [Eubacteriales bacterium]|nr:DNA repair protein RecO [Eubacteriales bacterium]
MSEKTELTGMVLSAAPIGEYDKRIVLLTRERGKISAFAKGARRQNSPLLAAAKPFSFGTFECFEGRSSYNIYQAQITNYFENLSLDFEGACYGMYFLEFADYYTRENNDESEMLKLLYVSLRALEKPSLKKELVRYIYELRAMVINGEYPEAFACVNCGSSENLKGYWKEKNGVLCEKCMAEGRGEPLLTSTIFTMQYVICAPLEKLYTFTVSEEVLKEFSRLQERFRRTYIDKKFKSLEIMGSLKI